MDSTFTRATLGFVMLTLALAGMAIIALWAMETYASGTWWASLLIVLFALVAEVSIYMTTLHEPIYDWIKEPKRLAEQAERDREYERRHTSQ